MLCRLCNLQIGNSNAVIGKLEFEKEKIMKEFIIREARSEDAKQIIEYIRKIGAETNNLTFGSEGLPVTVESEAMMLERMQGERHSVMFVAEKDGEIIGNGSLNGMPRRMSHRAELGITVLKNEWNTGVGSALMEELIDYAKKNEIEIINLEVRVDNSSAIHLYEKYGFQKIGVSPAFFKIENEYIDFLIMYLDLR